MKTIYMIRGWICRIFKQYELIAKVLLKFGAYLFIFRQIAGWDGFQNIGVLNAFSVHMLLALLCVLLPARFVAFFSVAIIVYNIYQVSFWGALMAAALLLVLYVMVSRLCPDETVLMILMPLAMKWNLVLVVPLFAGLYMGVFSIIPIVGGILLAGFLKIIPAFTQFNVTAIDALPAAMSETMSYIGDQLLKNENLIFTMILCAGVVLVVYLLNKISINYMRYLSLCVGALVGLVCYIVGKMAGMTDTGILAALVIPIVSLAIMIVVEFFHMALNYQMAQRLAFADDEYYYYVRAIPKILGIRNKTEVKTITTGRSQESRETEPVVVHELEPMEKPEAEAEHVPSEREEKLVAAVNEKKNQATRKLDSVLRQLGSKAKNMMDKTKDKLEQKKEDKQEPKKSEGTEIPKSPVHGENFEVPRPESAEELAKRTGWSEETIRGFFEGLDKESQQEDKEKK